MSRELLKTLDASLDANELEKLKGMDININGCPNSCGQAPIGFIGLTGMTKRIDNRMVPFYKISLGGRVEEGKTRFNEVVGSTPARNAPDVLRVFLVEAQRKAGSYKSPYEYLEAEGVEAMKKIIDKYSFVPPYSQDASFYRDWGKTEDFTLAGIGSAECGAGVMEIVESDMADAERNIAKAEERLDFESIREALHYAARALLVVRGIDPKTPAEAFDGFLKEIVGKGLCSPKFHGVKTAYDALNAKSDSAEKKGKLTLAKELLADVKEAFKLMDNNFNFQKRYPSGTGK